MKLNPRYLLFLAVTILVTACGKRESGGAGTRLTPRVLVFALDGATWKLMDPLLAEGKLPNFARLIDNGVRAELATLEPTVSPSIWTTIATGKLPEAHGILGFDGVPGQTMTTLPTSGMRKTKAFWNILPDHDISVGVLGWWATWPAEPVGEGSYIVTDRVPYTRMEAAIERETLTLEDAFPEVLLEILLPLVEGPNQIDPRVAQAFLNLAPDQIDQYLLEAEYTMGNFLPEFKYVYQSDRSTMKMAMHLIGTNPVDVLAVYLTGIDTVSHLFWHFTFPEGFRKYNVPESLNRQFGRVIPLYYELMDQYLGQLLNAIGENTTVLVVSDHGFGGTGYLPWSGGHGAPTLGAPPAPPGILILSGPGTASGARLEGAHVLDVAPTLFHLLGIPAGEDMPGRVLTSAIASEGRKLLPRVESHEGLGTPRRVHESAADPEGDAERLERLRSLGYLN